MRLARGTSAAAVLCFCFTSSVFAQKQDASFPSDDEVRLVLTQTERAVNEYKPLLDKLGKLPGKDNAESIAKDRELLNAISVAITAFRKDPQAFNGQLGFAFFEWLDDACRNALLSAVGTSNASSVALMQGDNRKAEANIDLAKDLSNVSNVFYTVSENAGALYLRYVAGEEKRAELAAQTVTECSNALKSTKKSATRP